MDYYVLFTNFKIKINERIYKILQQIKYANNIQKWNYYRQISTLLLKTNTKKIIKILLSK